MNLTIWRQIENLKIFNEKVEKHINYDLYTDETTNSISNNVFYSELEDDSKLKVEINSNKTSNLTLVNYEIEVITPILKEKSLDNDNEDSQIEDYDETSGFYSSGNSNDDSLLQKKISLNNKTTTTTTKGSVDSEDEYYEESQLHDSNDDDDNDNNNNNIIRDYDDYDEDDEDDYDKLAPRINQFIENNKVEMLLTTVRSHYISCGVTKILHSNFYFLIFFLNFYF